MLDEIELLYQAELTPKWLDEFIEESNKLDPNPNQTNDSTCDRHKDALIYAIKTAQEGCFALPHAVHKLLLGDHPLAGKFRQRDIKIGLSYPLDASRIRYFMWKWNRWVQVFVDFMRTQKEWDAEQKVSEIWNFHCIFEIIHPYDLCNGRVGRILMVNHALLVGIAPWIVPSTKREDYFELIKTHPCSSWGLEPPEELATSQHYGYGGYLSFGKPYDSTDSY